MSFYDEQDRWYYMAAFADVADLADVLDVPAKLVPVTDADLALPEVAVAAVEKRSFPDESSGVRHEQR